jgi:flagellar biosynthesis GTPase FlhF
MQYFTERGDSHAEVLAKVRNKYGSGPDVLISNQREVPVKSVWGKITRAKQWEISGAILEKNKVQPKKKDESIDNKLKLLEEMLNRTSPKRSGLPEQNGQVTLSRELPPTAQERSATDQHHSAIR